MAAIVPKDEPLEENIFTFQDDQLLQDPVYDYPDSLRDSKVPLIIDNGSYKCRVGWATDDEPRLLFKNVVAKARGKKEESQTLVGNDITNLEVMRWQLKSQFDRNIVTQYDVQESVFDYIFSHMGITTEGCVDHPIVLTEALCNPNYCRQQMTELLFECYHVPQVLYGVDSLFSLYKNHPKPDSADALIISCGYSTTHVIPVLSGRVCAARARRINLGGSQLDGYMQRLIQLKHPGHLAQLNVSRAEEMTASHGRFASDYAAEIKQWSCDDYYNSNVKKYQLPFTQVQKPEPANPEVLKLRREEQGKRLKELAARKREEKLIEETETLKQLMHISELLEDEDDENAYLELLKRTEFDSYNEIQDEIGRLTQSIQKLRQRIMQEDEPVDMKPSNSASIVAEPPEAKKMKVEILKHVGEPPVKAPASAMKTWVEKVKVRRQELLNKKQERRQRRTDMTKRRTHASQQRMKIITELAQGLKRKKEDTFGMKDSDWNLYKAINKDAGDSDSEAEQEQIDELEMLLREHDPDYKDPTALPTEAMDIHEYYRLHVAVEQIRVPEVLFQPSMIGVDQAGIAETLEFVLKKFTPEEQDKLCQYVFLTGGCASFPNLAGRLERELMAMRPFQSTFSVFKAQDPVLDAWLGARAWSSQRALLDDAALTRTDYEEKGGEYLKERVVTNRYFPTPSSNNGSNGSNPAPTPTPATAESLPVSGSQ